MAEAWKGRIAGAAETGGRIAELVFHWVSNQISLMKWLWNIEPDGPEARTSMSWLPKIALRGNFPCFFSIS
ncbi:MAG: hypothetical protein HFI04_04845 [Lachnospiraceae bacterium]|nr:hypothetical protein [Lachnospiraceae bacterium]